MKINSKGFFSPYFAILRAMLMNFFGCMLNGSDFLAISLIPLCMGEQLSYSKSFSSSDSDSTKCNTLLFPDSLSTWTMVKQTDPRHHSSRLGESQLLQNVLLGTWASANKPSLLSHGQWYTNGVTGLELAHIWPAGSRMNLCLLLKEQSSKLMWALPALRGVEDPAEPTLLQGKAF